ncbi:hypothetical protein [Pseudomonas kurunegalensis]|uniref:hypothetical protein n=1 Tax=Pseudomonas kurunegalensis TaxID=485880 RepID=UPI002118890A|nr:hypothetical protein [Pseudomonas kurunegalensis]
MPTENRSSNTEMVSVPRALAERISNICMFTMYKEDWRALSEILAKPAEQHQGEPVAPVINAEQVLGAYQFASFGPANYLRGTTNWCAAFAQELNHRIGADTAEVERIGKELREVRDERDDLRRRVDDFQSRSHGIKNLSVIEQLNDKLAERDALLREALEFIDDGVGRSDAEWQLIQKLRSALSASAEPSAPVEIDERAVTNAFHDWAFYKKGEAIGRMDGQQAALEGFIAGADWQARAALERKPS